MGNTSDHAAQISQEKDKDLSDPNDVYSTFVVKYLLKDDYLYYKKPGDNKQKVIEMLSHKRAVQLEIFSGLNTFIQEAKSPEEAASYDPEKYHRFSILLKINLNKENFKKFLESKFHFKLKYYNFHGIYELYDYKPYGYNCLLRSDNQELGFLKGEHGQVTNGIIEISLYGKFILDVVPLKLPGLPIKTQIEIFSKMTDAQNWKPMTPDHDWYYASFFSNAFLWETAVDTMIALKDEEYNKAAFGFIENSKTFLKRLNSPFDVPFYIFEKLLPLVEDPNNSQKESFTKVLVSMSNMRDLVGFNSNHIISSTRMVRFILKELEYDKYKLDLDDLKFADIQKEALRKTMQTMLDEDQNGSIADHFFKNLHDEQNVKKISALISLFEDLFLPYFKKHAKKLPESSKKNSGSILNTLKEEMPEKTLTLLSSIYNQLLTPEFRDINLQSERMKQEQK